MSSWNSSERIVSSLARISIWKLPARSSHGSLRIGDPPGPPVEPACFLVVPIRLSMGVGPGRRVGSLRTSLGHSVQALPGCGALFAKPLTQYGNAKDDGDEERLVFQVEIDLAGAAMDYEPGDSLSVYAPNPPLLVSRVLAALRADPSAPVLVPSSHSFRGPTMPLCEALARCFDLRSLRRELLEAFLSLAPTGSTEALSLGERLAGDPTSLSTYLSERELDDVLAEYPRLNVPLSRILGALRPLQPRAYSISSSPMIAPGRVALTVAAVRYRTLGRKREGVASSHLWSLAVGSSLSVSLSPNRAFRLPQDLSLPVLMIGPGTGLAPFRAFLQHRLAQKATGENVLYFGCRHRDQDFLYREELGTQTPPESVHLAIFDD